MVAMSPDSASISREQLAELPIRRYEGPIHLLETVGDLDRAMADIRAESVLGFDTETRPAFRKGESHSPSLVQLATERAVYLFPLRRLACADALGEILGSPDLIKAGVAMAHDLRQLRQLFPFEAAGMVDLGTLARHRGLEQTGLRNLAALLLGFRIPKGARTTNWAAPHLTQAQVRYAATDAWVGRELFLHFQRLGQTEFRFP